MGFFDEPPSSAGAAGFNASMARNRARQSAGQPLSIQAAQQQQQSDKNALYAQHLQRATQLHYGGVNQAVTPPVSFAARHPGDQGAAGSELEYGFANPNFGTGGGSQGSMYAQNLAQQHPGLTGGTVGGGAPIEYASAFGKELGKTFANPGPLPPMAPSFTHSEQMAGKPRPPSLQGAGELAVSREPGHMAPPSGVAATAQAPKMAAMPQAPQVQRPATTPTAKNVAAQPAPAPRYDHWGTEIGVPFSPPPQRQAAAPPQEAGGFTAITPPRSREVSPASPPPVAGVQPQAPQGDPIVADLHRQLAVAGRTDPALYGYLLDKLTEYTHAQSFAAQGQASIDETKAKLAASAKVAGMDPFMSAELHNPNTMPSRLGQLKAQYEAQQRVNQTTPTAATVQPGVPSATAGSLPAFDAKVKLGGMVPGLEGILGADGTGVGEVLGNMRGAGYSQVNDPQSEMSNLLRAILQERAGTAGWKSEQHPWAESPGLNRTLNAMPFGLGSAAKSAYDWWQGPEALQASAWARGGPVAMPQPPAMSAVKQAIRPNVRTPF